MERLGEHEGDRVERDARDIVEAGRDLEAARRRELAIGQEVNGLDAELLDLKRREQAIAGRREALAREAEELRRREVADEERVAADLRDIRGEQGPVCDPGQHPPRPGGDNPPPAREYEFYVDGRSYRTELSSMTGRQIKAKVADWVADHDLVLEGEGSAPDRIIGDDEVVDFATAPHPLHFNAAPKANFG